MLHARNGHVGAALALARERAESRNARASEERALMDWPAIVHGQRKAPAAYARRGPGTSRHPNKLTFSPIADVSQVRPQPREVSVLGRVTSAIL